MIQNIIVGIIVLVSIFLAVRSIIKKFTHPNENKCSGCSSDCKLRSGRTNINKTSKNNKCDKG
ncbi:FeoB-associated Cys-rich membrane protein [Marinilabiliaceae bacterium JC040]|nr:FeoB-associated Cys-rich membrane protein [Marinilabiliaceae bacterium JC040]